MVFTVSAPGKTILFGEHAVVHGCPAIAASVDLRTYITIEKTATSKCVELNFPDVGLSVGWTYEELKNAVDSDNLVGWVREVPQELDPTLLKHVRNLVETTVTEGKAISRVAAVAFLYLYLSIYLPNVQPDKFENLKFTTSSTLPIGAGLGSSASFSVCMAASLLKTSGQISSDTSHDEAMNLITKWSFLGECCIHGKPSGIDNIVATRGGAVYFKRSRDPKIPPFVKPYGTMPELQLILTDTGVSRQTSTLVARVSGLKDRWPTIFQSLMHAFASIVEQANALLGKPVSDVVFAQKFGELADLNHGLLATVDVSHPSLENVRTTAKELNIGSTKLTGAGGGGCAITIALTDPTQGTTIDVFRERLGPQFCVFVTRLGGPGVGWSDDIAFTPSEQEKLHWNYW